MALIKCPECGKEVSDRAGNCPGCGCPIQPEPENHFQEPGTGTQGEDADMAQGEQQKAKLNGFPGMVENMYQSGPPMSAVTKPARKSRKLLLIGAVLGAITLVAFAVGIFVFLRNAKISEQHDAENRQIREYNHAVDNLNALYSASYKGASDAESVCVLTINVWVNSIYNKKSDETDKYTTGTSDFNGAIQNVYDDEEIKEKLTNVKDAQSKANTYIQELQTIPAGLEKCYDAALQVHTTFTSLAEQALAPSGNITSYREAEQQKVDDYVNAYNTLGALIPAKKEVPLYNLSGKKVKDEFAFTNYINQRYDKLKDIEDESVGGLMYYKGSGEICGVKGEISYSGGGTSPGIINYIVWRVENPKEGLQEQLLERLRERYGKEDAGDNGSYSWGKNENLLLKVEDNKISISWFNTM